MLITELTTMVSVVPDAMDITSITFANIHNTRDVVIRRELQIAGNIVYRKVITQDEYNLL
jgi:outer membrane protein assembly factor BamA